MGCGMLLRERQPRAVLSVLGAAAILWGALDVFIVVLALDVLALGESGVGYLNAALGAGGLLGAAFSVSLIGRRGLAGPLGLGVLLWSVPLAAIGLIASVPAAAAMLALAGVGRVLMDVTATTLLQRATDSRMLARLFGALEGIHMASLAVGSIVAPLLIALAGERAAFLLAATAMLLAAAAAWPTMRRLDDAAVARPREVALLRSIPMFAPLGVAAIDRLAVAMVPVHAHTGSAVVRQGDPGDHFYIITDGRVAVSIDGQRIREEGPGESFGEIALLRNVARTATVEALEATQLISLDRTHLPGGGDRPSRQRGGGRDHRGASPRAGLPEATPTEDAVDARA